MSAPDFLPTIWNTVPGTQQPVPTPVAQTTGQGQFFNFSNQDGIYDIGGQKFKINQGISPYQSLLDSGLISADSDPAMYQATGYPTIQSMGANGQWSDYNLIGGNNRGLHAAAALQDPRFAQWLSQDDPSTQADNLVRGVWARDPAEALGLYGQQAARKPGGIDKTPDADWFTDEKYWPSIYGSAATGVDKNLRNDTYAVAQQLGLVNQDTANASASWARDMSPAAQHERNDPDGPWGQVASLVGTALMFVPGMQGVGMAINTMNAAANKNPLGVVTGLAGLGGFDIAGGLTGYLEPTLGSVGANLASGAIMGGGGALLSGGNVLKGALSGGLTGGLNQYANSLGLDPWARGAITGAGGASIRGGVNGNLSGRNILAGGLSGLAGGMVDPSYRPLVQGLINQYAGRGGTANQRYAAGAMTPNTGPRQPLSSGSTGTRAATGQPTSAQMAVLQRLLGRG